jgi:Protein of unknown function (DUF3455)
MIRRIAVLTLLLVAVGSRGEQPPPMVVIPKDLAIPAGYKKVASFEAKGDQIYKLAILRKGGNLEWVLEAPKAVLYDDKGKKAGTHTAGPTWEANDGSKLVLDKGVKAKSAPSSDPKADIPWLLLRVKGDGKKGILSNVVYVHRLNTHGGVAPKVAPKNIEDKVSVPYTATYVFYAKKE